METKRCYRCKEEKPLSEFGKDSRSKDGLNGCCKACKKLYNAAQKDYLKEYMKTYRANYTKPQSRRVHEKEYSREYRTKHPDKNKETSKRYRDRLKENGGSIKQSDTEICLEFFNRECAYSGVPLIDGYNFDHIVPASKGGKNEIHNMVPCLSVINRLKSNKDIAEWYPKQSFYSEERYNKILEWMKKSEE